jgi:hypothetical protein
MKRFVLVILISLVGILFALPLSVETRVGFMYENEDIQFLDQRNTLYVDIYKGFSLGFAVGMTDNEVATGVEFKCVHPTKNLRIIGRAGVWQFDDTMGYIGIGGEVPLKHIIFGLGADMGWTKTRSFVAPSVWIILH